MEAKRLMKAKRERQMVKILVTNVKRPVTETERPVTEAVWCLGGQNPPPESKGKEL